MIRQVVFLMKTAETVEFRFKDHPSHDAALLLDSMILGLEDIEDSEEYESYIDIIFKEV